MNTQSLSTVEPGDIKKTSRRGRLYASEQEVNSIFCRFSIAGGESPCYAFRTADGTLITVYRREDTAKDEWSIGGFDGSAVDRLKEVLPGRKILTNKEWGQELEL